MVPALFADGQYFAVNHYVKFDVFAVATIFQRVFTVFHFIPPTGTITLFLAECTFKTHLETTSWRRGESCVKVKSVYP